MFIYMYIYIHIVQYTLSTAEVFNATLGPAPWEMANGGRV